MVDIFNLPFVNLIILLLFVHIKKAPIILEVAIHFWGKLYAVGLQIYTKLMPPQILYKKNFAKGISFIIFL